MLSEIKSKEAHKVQIKNEETDSIYSLKVMAFGCSEIYRTHIILFKHNTLIFRCSFSWQKRHILKISNIND